MYNTTHHIVGRQCLAVSSTSPSTRSSSVPSWLASDAPPASRMSSSPSLDPAHHLSGLRYPKYPTRTFAVSGIPASPLCLTRPQNYCGHISRSVRLACHTLPSVLTQGTGEYAFDFAVVIFGVIPLVARQSRLLTPLVALQLLRTQVVAYVAQGQSSCIIAYSTLSEKVEYEKVEHDGTQCEIGKCSVCALIMQDGMNNGENGPLGRHVLELGAVVGVDLRPQRRGEHKLSDRAREPTRPVSQQTQPTTATAYPAKKALKGKLVTSTQYANWSTPESTMNVKKASMNLRRSGVFCMYDVHSADSVCEDGLGPAMIRGGAKDRKWNRRTCLQLFLMNAARVRLAASKKTCPTPWAPRRHVHTRRELPYKIGNGLGAFMSPRTLQMVAVEYQQGLLDRLNAECRGKHLVPLDTTCG